MITNGAALVDIELRRNAAFVLAYDITVDGVVLSLTGKTHTIEFRQKATDDVVFTKTFTPDVDNNIVVLLTKAEIEDLPLNVRMDYYIVETGDVMIAYGDAKVVK